MSLIVATVSRMSDTEMLPPELHKLFSAGRGAERKLSVPLPPGHVVHGDEGDGPPALWITDEPVTDNKLWGRLLAEHFRSDLWPLLLEPLRTPPGTKDEFRPWESGEFFFDWRTSPSQHDPTALLARWWDGNQDGDVTAPYGATWPGLAPAREFRVDPDIHAIEYATFLVDDNPNLRLGLVATDRGADSPVACGWSGPMNFTNDTGEISAVLQSWEDRFGVRVVCLGFADLYVSVAAPPTTLDDALHIAAEHLAFCPDNIYQGAGTLQRYAEILVNAPLWHFWWD
jgi:hypothetical protein